MKEAEQKQGNLIKETKQNLKEENINFVFRSAYIRLDSLGKFQNE